MLLLLHQVFIKKDLKKNSFMKVNIDKLNEAFRLITEIDEKDLSDLEFFENGEAIKVNEGYKEQFKKLGLSNSYFILTGFYKM